MYSGGGSGGFFFFLLGGGFEGKIFDESIPACNFFVVVSFGSGDQFAHTNSTL